METDPVNFTDDSNHSSSGMSGYDPLLVGAVFFCSLVVGFSLTMFGFIVYYYCTLKNKKSRTPRTIDVVPTYIRLDPIKYSQMFAEDTLADVSIRFCVVFLTINKFLMQPHLQQRQSFSIR